MTGWCPIDGEVCRHDGYCHDCSMQKGNLHCLRYIEERRSRVMEEAENEHK